MTIELQDDGIGLHDDYEVKENQSLGLYLVDTLTKQLEGEIRMGRKP